jgi:SAM-dependent methyltransferase
LSTTLHRARFAAVLAVLHESAARTVLDLGCGDGELLLALAAEPAIDRVVGIDIDASALAELRRALARCQASYTAPDLRLAGFAAAVMVETLEHVAPGRLAAVEHAVFRGLAPGLVVVTTPNADFNPLLGVPAHRFRHPDHRFEWGRARFAAWVEGVASRHGYAVTITDLGGRHPTLGGPSQMAVFRRPARPV